MAKSSSLARRVQSYVPPKYFRLFTAYVSVNDTSDSKVVVEALKEKFDRMTESERAQLLFNFENFPTDK